MNTGMANKIARKILDNPELLDCALDGISLKDLFRIRDCQLMLRSINPVFCDEALLKETEECLIQKVY